MFCDDGVNVPNTESTWVTFHVEWFIVTGQHGVSLTVGRGSSRKPSATVTIMAIMLEISPATCIYKEMMFTCEEKNVLWSRLYSDNFLVSLHSKSLWPINDPIGFLTCVLPPELSCTAVLERAVLAANDLKVAPNMLLTPNAMSSCRWGGMMWREFNHC